ncbi:hypothetical protein HDU87_008535 [Geranomyces variabilis]|uniref:Uncharacterized protein n=1 Tax=Geranomyces variabilis TaxID=109894 RepID=A0AAD5TNS4_9FUNG|nr:hypothetical protein HDU87_008535 [Geranomyces variabilis]
MREAPSEPLATFSPNTAPDVSEKPPAFSLKRPLEDRAFDLSSLLESHRNDDGLYTLFRSLQAPYEYMDHCQQVLHSRLRERLDNFFLIPCGSFNNRTALMSTADLDIDLILPRIHERFKPESLDAKARERDPSHPGYARAAVFQELLEDIRKEIAPETVVEDPNANLKLDPQETITRSLPLLLRVDGRDEPLDLFV